MTNFNLEIIQQPNFVIDIQTSTIENLPNVVIDVETSNLQNVVIELVKQSVILVSDLPDDIPFTKIKKNGINGVDYYLDTYEFDCGSP